MGRIGLLSILGILGSVTAPVGAAVSGVSAPGALAHSVPMLARSYGQVPLQFERNDGQTDRRVKFLSRGGGQTLFLTGDEAVLCLRRGQNLTPGPSPRIRRGE